MVRKRELRHRRSTDGKEYGNYVRFFESIVKKICEKIMNQSIGLSMMNNDVLDEILDTVATAEINEMNKYLRLFKSSDMDSVLQFCSQYGYNWPKH